MLKSLPGAHVAHAMMDNLFLCVCVCHGSWSHWSCSLTFNTKQAYITVYQAQSRKWRWCWKMCVSVTIFKFTFKQALHSGRPVNYLSKSIIKPWTIQGAHWHQVWTLWSSYITCQKLVLIFGSVGNVHNSLVRRSWMTEMPNAKILTKCCTVITVRNHIWRGRYYLNPKMQS